MAIAARKKPRRHKRRHPVRHHAQPKPSPKPTPQAGTEAAPLDPDGTRHPDDLAHLAAGGHQPGATVPEPVRDRIHPGGTDPAARGRDGRRLAGRPARRLPGRRVGEAGRRRLLVRAAVAERRHQVRQRPGQATGEGRLDLRQRPRQLDTAAPRLLEPVGARDDDRLLVLAPAHPDRARLRLGAPLRLRRHHPGQRARHVRGPAGRLLSPPRHAALPRQLDVGEERTQREPGP